MPRFVQLDFTDAPPAQGSGGITHIPPGKYPFKVTGAELRKSRAGNDMIVTTYEVTGQEHPGAVLRDNFVFAQPGGSKYGMQRFHAFLLALGAKVQPSMKLDLDSLVGHGAVVQVVDEEIPASGEYEAKMASKPFAYFTARGDNPASSATSANGSAPAQAPTPIQAPTKAQKQQPAAASPEPADEDATIDEETSNLIDNLFA